MEGGVWWRTLWGWQNQGSLCSPPRCLLHMCPPSSLHPQVPAQDPGRGTFVLGTQHKEPSQGTAGGVPSCPPPVWSLLLPQVRGVAGSPLMSFLGGSG